MRIALERIEKYLYLFQENLPPAVNSREESQERRRKRNSRESDSRERLTERPVTEKPPIDLAASIADCCCIGPRSRLPLPRIPPAIMSSMTTAASSASSSSASSASCPSIVTGGYPSREIASEYSSSLPASTTSVAETTPTLANNSRGAVQTSVGNIGSTSQQQQQQQQQPHYHYYQQHYPQAAVAAVTSSYSPPTTTPCSPSTSLGYSSGVPTTTQTVSVPRQLAQWTKHQTLKLQVLASSIACQNRSFISSVSHFSSSSFRCPRVDYCFKMIIQSRFFIISARFEFRA